MPLYESKTNALNVINNVNTEWAQQTVSGLKNIAQFIASKAKIGTAIAIDGWMGADFAGLINELKTELGNKALFISTTFIYNNELEITQYKQQFITDDPAFGKSNTKGQLKDVMSAIEVNKLKETIEQNKKQVAVIVYGVGSAIESLKASFNLIIYADNNQQKLLWQMWDGKLIPFNKDEPQNNYFWKEYYYSDFYLLHHQKQQVFNSMQYYIDSSNPDELKLLTRKTFDAIIREMVNYPVKEVKIFQPGPWGAYRYQDLFDVPGLGCNAWNELAGPELNILVDIGSNTIVNMPVTNLMQYAELFVGKHIADTLPNMIPFDVWLNDGYFPEPVPQERSSMPIHNHPSTDYVKRNFNEPLGRYETYYIAEAYEGANTLMGFKEDISFEEWKEKCYESERTGQAIDDWTEYVKRWETNVGDLFLIPPGTTHGHGGNQMVLEMDTSASPCGTEYSFFTYDFCRPTWNDEKQTMTGKPMKMHNHHGFNMDEARREDWVKNNLFIRQPDVIKWTKEYAIDRYKSYDPMPFEIERIHFANRAEYDTLGRFMHIPTLTVGKRVLIRSLSNPAYQTEIDIWQACLIPASFEKYEIINLSEGMCTLVYIRWKKG